MTSGRSHSRACALLLLSLTLTMHTLVCFCLAALTLTPPASVQAASPPCDSEIFCTGPILQQVQNAKLFDDDKYFVDMKLRAAPDVVSLAFHNLSKEFPNATVPPDRLKGFLSAYFEEPGTEFESWTPPDWHEEPTFLGRIADQQLRDWAKKIHALWKSLGRKMRAGVQDHPELHSLIYAPHPVVVPGGRFREFYYWDSYWVVNGLLLSEMTDTARGMIQNFLHLVNRYGFIPNGGRIYYERRSQPPFLTLMVESYYHATKDKEFLRDALPTLEKEYSFWMHNRSVAVQANGVEHVLNRYHVQVESPRPESYTDDVELAEGLPDALKEQLWMDLHSGAESGWDFSSRWFLDNRTLRHTRTSQIVPSDLNALMCLNEKTLAFFHTVLGDGAASDRYDRAVTRRLAAMESVLWDPGSGAWFDYNLVTNAKNRDFYPSNLAPVWARCYSRPEMGDLAVKYLKGTHALDYHNGVPTSLFESGQQWDFPNAWPPLQHMLIDGLSKLPSEDANALAFTLAQRWIKTNWMAYVKYEAMFEKYDVNGDGKPGGGGEYEVQLGFGWTNGVALQLLNQYGDRLSSGGRSVTFDLLMPLVVSAALAFM